jgi:RHS repeat-associated protein
VCFQAGTCPGGSDPFVRWTYDKVGNRLTAERPGQTLTYTHNALDQLTAVGSTSFTYDQNGNQLTRGTARTYAYDQANRMKSATVSGTTTTYSYDGDGVRLQASTGPSASENTSFLWDLNQALPQLALERDGAGALLRRYTYGVKRLTMVSGSTTSYYHSDGLGSVAAITGGAGNTRWTYAYESFGIIRTEQQGSGTQPANFLKFTGEYLDPTGLYHLRARQYDPTWSRFLSPDPVEPGTGSPYTASYMYAGNRPTVMVDPSGAMFRPADAGQRAARESTSPVDEPWLRPDAPSARRTVFVHYSGSWDRSAHIVFWTGAGRISWEWLVEDRSHQTQYIRGGISEFAGCRRDIAPCINHLRWDPAPRFRVIRIGITAENPLVIAKWLGDRWFWLPS